MKIDKSVINQGRSDRFSQFVLDAIDSGILVLDSEGKILFSNPKAQELIQSSRLLEGLEFSLLFPDEDRKILAPNILKIARERGEFQGDVMLKRINGTGFMAHLSIVSWQGCEEDAPVLIVTLTDLSRLKDLERLLHKSERMIYLGQMLSDISHQIRNPVLAIGGFARRLQTTHLEKPEYVKVIMEEASRLEQLLDILTRFIQLPKPKFSISKAQRIIDLVSEMAKEICRNFRVDLRFSTIYDSDHFIVTDLALLKSAIEPIIVNACEAYQETSQKGDIRIGFEQAGKPPWKLRITVNDFGIGIRPPFIDKIFSPFFTTKTGHLGMGLTFTKRILGEIGGKIEVSSSLGKGTMVVIDLPGDRRKAIRTTLL